MCFRFSMAVELNLHERDHALAHVQVHEELSMETAAIKYIA